MQVDLIVRNARIYPGDTGAPSSDALAVLHGRIVAVGADVDGLRAQETLDARGRVVLPGFADAHAHSVWFGMTLMEADLSAVRSLDEIYRIIGDRAASTDGDEWIVASGFNPVLLQGQNPDPDQLDRASGGRPVWIKHASGHSCQLSTAGLTRTGALSRAGQSFDGGRIVVDDAGHATGVLEERAMSLVRDVLLPYPLAMIEQALDLATAAYAREGLTAVTDCGVAAGWIGHAPGEVAAYQNALEHGALRTRMQVMPVIDALPLLEGHADEPVRRGLGTGVRTGWGDDRLMFGPTKVFTDGSILGRTAQLTDHYDGCPGHHGYLQEDPDVMRERMIAAYAGGWSLALHAVGDAALDLALDTLEEAVRKHGSRRVPNRVEHGIAVRPDQLARLAELGIACVVQPGFIRAFGEGMRRALGESRVPWSVRARTLLDAGLPLGHSSDRPVAPGAPLASIQSFVERLTEDGLPYGPAERITPAEAVRAATLGTAEVTGQADRRGRLVPGQLADMVFLDAHPAEVPPSDIHAIPILATAVGGEFTYRSEELPS
ncbi:amidohydrolase [Tsukamurella sp. 8F]|uniref:amidohydrolase n=1 Tax=unclassified Tsukamurella TaxID=2633480 RepID=UPI0023B9FE7B|nr:MULTISPECIES: amidohydrolase [unclassified Tsukamurella]MDF0532342.1 amidohydrolase [Tsukamurella sp. 8J]MDF0589460.1 amidohydrolase [Tsukamurella sp. 8F]